MKKWLNSNSLRKERRKEKMRNEKERKKNRPVSDLCLNVSIVMWTGQNMPQIIKFFFDKLQYGTIKEKEGNTVRHDIILKRRLKEREKKTNTKNYCKFLCIPKEQTVTRNPKTNKCNSYAIRFNWIILWTFWKFATLGYAMSFVLTNTFLISVSKLTSSCLRGRICHR